MKMINKVILSARDGSLKNKATRKIVECFVKNSNTRNKLLEDIALDDMRKKYSERLRHLVQSYPYEPMEYSNRVWVYWRQGYDEAPELVKACFDSVKRNLTDRDIIFVSDANIGEYIKMPIFIEQKKRGGVIPEALYSDIVRISLLAEYGGLWLDSTVFCTGSRLAEKMKDWPMFVFKMEDIDRTDEMALVCSNWLISCYTNMPFIKAVRDLLYCYWENENHVNNYFLFHLFMHMVKDEYKEIWKGIPVYNNISPHILAFEMMDEFSEDRFQDIKAMSDFHKLNRHVVDELPQNFNSDNTFYQMIVQQKAI